MNKTAQLAFFLFLLAIPYATSAYSMYAVNSLLASYSVPGSLINTLYAVELNYAGKSYLGLYNSSQPYFIINLTKSSNYSIVLNTTSIYSIIRNYTVAAAIMQINFSLLKGQMQKYQASSAQQLDDCYDRTGYTSGLTCNITNYCAACQSVPLCGRYFNNATININGPFYTQGLGIFGTAVMVFGNQYRQLNQSFAKFYAAVVGTNSTSLSQKTASAYAAYLNISNLTNTIPNSTLFSYTGSFNQLSVCSNYGDNPAAAPWYCFAIGYCDNLDYNYTKLAYIGELVEKLRALPVSSSQIMQLANNVSANEGVYLYPILSKSKGAQLSAILNKSVPGYATLVNNTLVLLTHINNSTLRSDMSTLQDNYRNVTANYLSANLSLANATLSVQYATLSNDYARLNSSYSSVLAYAANNTAKIIELQLYGGPSTRLSDLALQELALNSQLTSKLISNVTLLSAQLRAIATQLSQFSTSPITLTEIARGADSSFIRGFASTLSLSYPTAVGAAPLLGSFLSLIIGIALIACIFFFRSYLALHHKLAVNRRTTHNWRRFMLAIGVLVLLYVIITYALLADASASAPFSAFQSAYKASHYLVIAMNGTPTLSAYTCASTISAQAFALNKKPVVISLSNGVCTAGNSTGSVSSCMGFYSNLNIPVVILTSGSQSGMSLYSLYGSVLNVAGNDSAMNSCYVSLLAR